MNPTACLVYYFGLKVTINILVYIFLSTISSNNLESLIGWENISFVQARKYEIVVANTMCSKREGNTDKKIDES